jgi:ribosomal protein L12E/L44/L45/RPP1/RPP2
MQDPNEAILFHTARNAIEAQIIRTLLEAAGIPVHIPGVHLTDEFATTRQATGLSAVEIHVPRARLAEAAAALREARDAGTALPEDS